LFQIAQRYNVSVADIATANNIADVNSLAVGQSLVIPAAGSSTGAPTAVPPTTGERTHVVQPGENLYRIGLRYGFTVNELASYNNIANPDRLEVGQVIRIPPGG
jgi:LysM repeat protein